MVWKDNSFNYDYSKGIYIETFIQIQNVTILGLILLSFSNVCSNECHVPGWDLYYSAQMMMVTKTSSPKLGVSGSTCKVSGGRMKHFPSFREGFVWRIPTRGVSKSPREYSNHVFFPVQPIFFFGGLKGKKQLQTPLLRPQNWGGELSERWIFKKCFRIYEVKFRISKGINKRRRQPFPTDWQFFSHWDNTHLEVFSQLAVQ